MIGRAVLVEWTDSQRSFPHRELRTVGWLRSDEGDYLRVDRSLPAHEQPLSLAPVDVVVIPKAAVRRVVQLEVP